MLAQSEMLFGLAFGTNGRLIGLPLWVSTDLFLPDRIVAFAALAKLYMFGQSEPSLGHGQKDHLGTRVRNFVSELSASLGVCPVRVTTTHEKWPGFSR